MTKKEEAQLFEDVRAIKQCLLGFDGQGGLVKDHKELKNDHYKLKRWFLALFFFLSGSGLLIGGGIGISNIIGG